MNCEDQIGWQVPQRGSCPILHVFGWTLTQADGAKTDYADPGDENSDHSKKDDQQDVDRQFGTNRQRQTYPSKQ